MLLPPRKHSPEEAELGEAERARWVSLLLIAAQEAGLPGDAGFRSVLHSCIEWRATGVGPVPVWSWGPVGPPAQSAADVGASEVPVVPVPGPDEKVSFTTHVKPLFRETDRQAMSWAFDLWSRDDVAAHAEEIADRLRQGSMPCDGPWPAERVELFERWARDGARP